MRAPCRHTLAVLVALSLAAPLAFAASAPAAVVTDRPLLFSFNLDCRRPVCPPIPL